MTHKSQLELPEAIWNALLQHPEHRLEFERGKLRLELRLLNAPETLGTTADLSGKYGLEPPQHIDIIDIDDVQVAIEYISEPIGSNIPTETSKYHTQNTHPPSAATHRLAASYTQNAQAPTHKAPVLTIPEAIPSNIHSSLNDQSLEQSRLLPTIASKYPDLSTNPDIQRIPAKIKTADLQLLIGNQPQVLSTHNTSKLQANPHAQEESTLCEIPTIKSAVYDYPPISSGFSTVFPKADELQLCDEEHDLHKSHHTPVTPVNHQGTENTSNSSHSSDDSNTNEWSVEVRQVEPNIPPAHNEDNQNVTPIVHSDLIARNSLLTNLAGDSWISHPYFRYRLLRENDTLSALDKLFRRKTVSPAQLTSLFQLPLDYIDSVQFAHEHGIIEILSQSVPFCDTPNSMPVYRVVGRRQDGQYMILIQHNQTMTFVQLSAAHSVLQIALIEGEDLFTEAELADLFQTNSYKSSPKEAQAKAQQIQHKLQSGTFQSTTHSHDQAIFSPPDTLKAKDDNALNRSIDVDQRLIKRFDYQRNNDHKNLWDLDMQPGIAIFRDNTATLYIDAQVIIEGLLLCLLKHNQYIVFDRRTKRSVHLQPNTNQKIWLRRKNDPSKEA